jgi:hypothetical protein
MNNRTMKFHFSFFPLLNYKITGDDEAIRFFVI